MGQAEALPSRIRRMDGRRTLRHCTFVGMRDDKKPAEVVAKLESHRIGDLKSES